MIISEFRSAGLQIFFPPLDRTKLAVFCPYIRAVTAFLSNSAKKGKQSIFAKMLNYFFKLCCLRCVLKQKQNGAIK